MLISATSLNMQNNSIEVCVIGKERQNLSYEPHSAFRSGIKVAGGELILRKCKV